MARIALTGGFTVCPEGTYLFTVSSVKYDEEFGKLDLTFTADSGATHSERFSLLDNSGNPNSKAMNAFSFLAKRIMGNMDLADIDPELDLLGKRINATVTHTVTEVNGNSRTYAHLGDVSPAEESYDLDALL